MTDPELAGLALQVKFAPQSEFNGRLKMFGAEPETLQ